MLLPQNGALLNSHTVDFLWRNEILVLFSINIYSVQNIFNVSAIMVSDCPKRCSDADGDANHRFNLMNSLRLNSRTFFFYI